MGVPCRSFEPRISRTPNVVSTSLPGRAGSGVRDDAVPGNILWTF
jgi:hypothetical protein